MRMDAVLIRKLRDIETLPIQDIYKLPEFRRDKYRVYKDALGMISPEEKRREQYEMAQRCKDPEVNMLNSIYSDAAKAGIHSSSGVSSSFEAALDNSNAVAPPVR